MGTFSLRGTETTRDIKHCHISDKQGRTRGHLAYTKLVLCENLGFDVRHCNVLLLYIGLHNVPFTLKPPLYSLRTANMLFENTSR